MFGRRFAPGSLGLEPVRNAERRAAGFFATSSEPFLSVAVDRLPNLGGRFVEIIYRLAWWDEPVRPVFRFNCADGTVVDRIAAGPIAGAGIWVGRLPRDIVGIEVSPTNRVGRFDFRIEAIRPRHWLGLLRMGLRHRPRSTRSAILTKLIGWRAESDVNLAWAIGATPIPHFREWHAARGRELELGGIDAPRLDREVESFEILIGPGPAPEITRTLASLRDQPYANWTAVVPVEAIAMLPEDRRVRSTREAAALNSRTLTASLAAGDTLFPYALGYVAEQAARRSECRVFVGDTLASTDEAAIPMLRPGWSPRLEAASPIAGAFFVRNFADWPPDLAHAFVERRRPPDALIDTLAPEEIGVLRRMLVTTYRPAEPLKAADASPRVKARAAVVVPTRDHPDLLHRVVASVRAQVIQPRPRIVVVDNGSADPEALACLAALRLDADVTIREADGPFNFSAMCNLGADSGDEDVLVFLNDDTEFRTDDALVGLVTQAMLAEVGAVGARMTYPDGRLQHVGVVVGMGESAGHFGALASADDPGWAGRNKVVHEVSAVTGACLAVARAKFVAVGGFDAEHLPIELSDIDLCLKLAKRGWQTIVDPAVHLMHEESVSRGGATFRRLDVYAEQRRVFIERWRHVLRDDPFFHPGLSLYSCEAALG